MSNYIHEDKIQDLEMKANEAREFRFIENFNYVFHIYPKI